VDGYQQVMEYVAAAIVFERIDCPIAWRGEPH
jgi:hypothetical protein